MNFTTIEYDCNTPTVQQINIPTNTDYKVGIKVKKDGQDINLQPSQLTVGDYTIDDTKTNGYVTYKASTGDDASFSQLPVVVETEGPSEFGPTQAANLQKSVSGATACLNFNADLSSLAGRLLYAKNVILEASTDNFAGTDGQGNPFSYDIITK